jgi:tetratricopeptide (TPR) repeat protein
MTGHASARQREQIAYLEASIDLDKGPVDQLVKLAILYIEPMHQEDKAIELFKAILARYPEHGEAVYWLSYCYLHYLMDDAALREAKRLLYDHIHSHKASSGAHYALLAEVINELNGAWRQPDTGTGDPADWLAEVTFLLEESVRLEPNWVSNRVSLSWAYERLDRINEAIEQLGLAKQNIVAVDESWDSNTYFIEESVSGRVSFDIATRIDNKLNELQEHLQARN